MGASGAGQNRKREDYFPQALPGVYEAFTLRAKSLQLKRQESTAPGKAQEEYPVLSR